jgi:3-oxoacyl-[acyl-carrier protein] reductase
MPTLITGATKGIGRAIADHLLAQGEEIVGLSRTADPHFPAPLVLADLANEAEAAAALAQVLRHYEISKLVNNAGSSLRQDLLDLNLNDMRAMLNLNVQAAAQCAQACVPPMISRGYGRIVSIGSRAMLGRPGFSAYAGAKAALVGMTKCWALELAEKGITANVVAPGAIETDMLTRNNPLGSDRRKSLEASIPLRRTGNPAEVAAAVAYFLSDQAGYTTGQVLFVCGGWSFATP